MSDFDRLKTNRRALDLIASLKARKTINPKTLSQLRDAVVTAVGKHEQAAATKAASLAETKHEDEVASWRISKHEAAHCAVMVMVGGEMRRVTTGDYVGVDDYSHKQAFADCLPCLIDCELLVAVSVAGLAAERAFCGESAQSAHEYLAQESSISDGIPGDVSKAVEHLKFLFRQLGIKNREPDVGTVDAIVVCMESIFKHGDLAKPVRRVADALRQRNFILGPQATEMVRSAGYTDGWEATSERVKGLLRQAVHQGCYLDCWVASC